MLRNIYWRNLDWSIRSTMRGESTRRLSCAAARCICLVRHMSDSKFYSDGATLPSFSSNTSTENLSINRWNIILVLSFPKCLKTSFARPVPVFAIRYRIGYPICFLWYPVCFVLHIGSITDTACLKKMRCKPLNSSALIAIKGQIGVRWAKILKRKR